MAIPQSFFDELRARTTLSTVVAQDIKLDKAGREYKACCPFHGEKTPSFTVNDDKGFYHCFGCSAHGDALRWLTDHRGLSFVEAVELLAAEAGMTVPAPSPEAAERAERISGMRPTLEAAAAIYRRALGSHVHVEGWLAQRGVQDAAIAEFGIGYAVDNGGLTGQGFNRRDLMEVGLVGKSEATPTRDPFYYPRFRSRVMVPIHDDRGRLVGFGGRALPGVAKDGAAKYVNSSDSEIFDKGRLLFNLHRAREIYRSTRRLVIVEGYLDVIAAHGCGHATVAPMGTALTEIQLERAWRVDQCPLLLFDGDVAGAKAALRACETALPMLGPGRSLTIGALPAGVDPDDLVQAAIASGEDPAMALAVSVMMTARRVDQLLYAAAVAAAGDVDQISPEGIAGIWHQLAEWAAAIGDEETRLSYLAMWRARYEREFLFGSEVSGHPISGALAHKDAHLTGVWDEDHNYFWPDPVDDGERQVIRFLREKLTIRAQRRALTERGRDLDAMAKVIGLNPQMLNKVVADIEADPDAREQKEALWALYRRVAGVQGPMEVALLPSLVDGRAARGPSVAAKRLANVEAMIEGGV